LPVPFSKAPFLHRIRKTFRLFGFHSRCFFESLLNFTILVVCFFSPFHISSFFPRWEFTTPPPFPILLALLFFYFFSPCSFFFFPCPCLFTVFSFPHLWVHNGFFPFFVICRDFTGPGAPLHPGFPVWRPLFFCPVKVVVLRFFYLFSLLKQNPHTSTVLICYGSNFFPQHPEDIFICPWGVCPFRLMVKFFCSHPVVRGL